MRLSSLLEELKYTCIQGDLDKDISEVTYDSRKVKEGALFICIKGAVADGHEICSTGMRKRSRCTYHRRTGTSTSRCYCDPGRRYKICHGIYISCLVRTSCQKTEDHWDYRYQRKDYYYMYGKSLFLKMQATKLV